jgi:hypothetical protein
LVTEDLEFEAQAQYDGQVDPIVVVEQVGVREVLPQQRNDCLAIRARLADRKPLFGTLGRYCERVWNATWNRARIDERSSAGIG